VIVLCEARDVSTSAFYDWSNAQGQTDSDEKDAEVSATIREVFEESRQTYDKRRIKKKLIEAGANYKPRVCFEADKERESCAQDSEEIQTDD